MFYHIKISATLIFSAAVLSGIFESGANTFADIPPVTEIVETPVIVEQPVVVAQPVIVEQPAVVVERTRIIEVPTIVERREIVEVPTEVARPVPVMPPAIVTPGILPGRYRVWYPYSPPVYAAPPPAIYENPSWRPVYSGHVPMHAPPRWP